MLDNNQKNDICCMLLHMQKNGLAPSLEIEFITDGDLYPYAVSSDNQNTKSGWYAIFNYRDKIAAAVYGNCLNGSCWYWSSSYRNEISPSERVLLLPKIKRAKQKAEIRAAAMKSKHTDSITCNCICCFEDCIKGVL